MKFSKRSTYGLRAMARLAKYWNFEFIPLTEISVREGISKKYLEQIFLKLKKAKLVESNKGKMGGYRLVRKPEDIKVIEIVEVLEGGISPANCLGSKGEVLCRRSEKCGVISLLAKVQKTVWDVLDETTLLDLEKNHR